MKEEQEIRSLERKVSALQQELREAWKEGRDMRRQRGSGEYYRSLLHQLRSRWYLRPFIPQHVLEPPRTKSPTWVFRGARFGPSPPAQHRRHRVLIVGHALHSKLFGSENSLLELIGVIDRTRFDVFTVFPRKNERVFKQLEAYVDGIGVLDYGWWHKDEPFDEATVAAFGKIYRAQQIDLVHVNTIVLRDPLLAARRANIPAITNVREVISLDAPLAIRLGGTPAEIVKTVCDNATYLLANSATTLADYPCGDRGSYLYNPIDVRAFDFPNLVDPSRIKVGLISSNIPKKGIFDFLQLAREAADVLPLLQFHLIGPENEITKEWQGEAEVLPSNFHVHGYASQPADAYRDLNIVLNLSHFAESFGRTVAEAMAARRPVIAYRYGALPELIEDGKTGFLVPYLDLSAVLDRLRFFAGQPQNITAFGEAGRVRITHMCSPEAAKIALNALYERLIAENVTAPRTATN
jgi:glycosyltransferase involved in cell wall biosynthesis